ncbi:two-component sensor histidine kinase [Planosporangium thailandense]|uniref:histidine kinase n=1 Tax=Planosporangium thailandense TaxID=765197 RepID=A0ABX0XX48_9ACTN|nr:histidine kinase [Planosporangium thailandense]NJC69815.1 two-component sensor histidine kinase [Planosporangium thailandense]
MPGTRHLPRRIAYATALLTLLLAGTAVTLAALSGSGYALWYVSVGVLLGLVSVALGLVVAGRRPDNAVAPLLVLVGLIPIWMTGSDSYGAAVAHRPDLVPVSALVVTLQPGTWMFLYVPPALLALLFPTGRLPGRRWRWVVAGLVVVPVAFTVLAALDPTPFPAPFAHVPHAFGTVHGTAFRIAQVAAIALLPVLLGLLAATAAAMVVRYRREPDEVRRAQVKWFALGALFVPGTLLLCWCSYLFLDGPDLVLVGLAATFLAVPTATAIAILRHDLYDVDRAISATVTYGIVTAGLLGFYTAATLLGGLALGRRSAVTAAVATALCAAALAPLRTRLQRRVDRRLYPRRQAALATVEDLGRRTHAGTARPEQLEAALRVALRDPQLRVGYRLPGTTTYVDAAGAPLEPAGRRPVPVRLGGEEIGVLVPGGAASRELLREVAGVCALPVEVVRLRAELRQALREVESSRARLLHVGYSERRRLERDLHDGAQQRLVSLGMALRLAQRHLGDGSVDVDGVLDQAVAELGTAVAELRQIAHGLRPSSLDDGLAHALTTMVGTVPVPVTLDVCPDRLPDEVATTAYYVASEAVVNAVKHADAATIGLRVARVDGRLTVQIRDDGRGGARLLPGAGLAGLVDRVAAAGGGLRLTSPLGHGTLVEAELPCGS